MDKQFILNEIRRVAAENGGTAPGRARFENESGVRETDWSGRYWARWSDAVRAAGLVPNVMNPAMPDDSAIAKLATIARELGRIPTRVELKLRRQADRSIPSPGVFTRIGANKQALVVRLSEYCRRTPGFDDVLAICVEHPASVERATVQDAPILGEIYLIRSGRNYKIGRSVSADRRTRELQIQLPIRATRIHTIRTDDPIGIERYWHERFAAKRLNGEWFKLDAADVSAFRRRKFM